MAVTLADIRNDVIDITADFFTKTNSAIDAQINRTREEISNLVKIADLVTTVTVSTTNDISSYALPTRFKYEIYVYNRTQKEILPSLIPDKTVDIKKDLPDNGKPLGYQIRGKNILFFPTPDGVYDIEILYYQTPITLTVDTDTDYLNDEFREAIVYGTATRIFFKVGAFDLAKEYDAFYGRLLEERGYIEKLAWQQKILQFKKRFPEIVN